MSESRAVSAGSTVKYYLTVQTGVFGAEAVFKEYLITGSGSESEGGNAS